jgi:hypothetical protein
VQELFCPGRVRRGDVNLAERPPCIFCIMHLR